MEVVKETLLYKEVAATQFSLQSFGWREVKLRSLQSSVQQQSKRIKSSIDTGGFSYRVRHDGLMSSTCRNRCILWQYDGGILSLLELSMDFDLVGNAVRLVFDSPSVTFLGADIHEVENSSIVLTFSTSGAAYCLRLPHPEVIAKDAALSAVGEGLVPSVLAFCKAESFSGANMAPVFGMQDKATPLSCCASIVSVNGGSTFAYPSPSGSIFVVQLPPPGTHVLPTRSELKESSVINKLWNTLMPVMVKGSGEAEDAPASLALHTFGEETVILALCRGLQLKVWTVEQGQCVLTHNLSDYIQADEESGSKEDQLVLKKASFGDSSALRFALHMRVGGVSQVSLFELLLVESQLHLQPITTYRCPQNSSLMDFHLTDSEVWGVWLCRSGEEGEREQLLLKQAVYDCEAPTDWRDIGLKESPPDDVLVLPQSNPKEVYLDTLFHPGRFSTASMCKALELYGVTGIDEAALSREDLISLVTKQVETELQQSASSDELQHEEYRELSEKCWAKFYQCSVEYHHLLHRPTGLYQDPTTGLGVLIKKGVLSFVHPVHTAEYVNCNLTGDTVQCGDIGRFVRGIKETISQLNRDVLDSFFYDLGNHANMPISMARDIAAALHEDGASDILLSFLSFIPDLSSVLGRLVDTLDPTLSDTEDMEQGSSEDTDLQAALSQLCASSVATVMLGSSLQETCLSRLCLCRDVLIALCTLELTERAQISPNTEKKYIPVFAKLLHCYHSLHWLVTRPTLTHTPGEYESNLKLLASLEITPKKVSRSMSNRSSSTTLAELFVSTCGRTEIATALAQGGGATPLHPHWGALTPMITNSLLRALWPISSACNACEFLLASCQYLYVQDFVAGVRMYSSTSWYSLEFLLGQGFLGNGEMEKALACFTRAAAGVGSSSEPYLERVCGVEGEASGGEVLRYYIKVLRLFEQFPSPSYVVKIAELATRMVGNDDPETAILWSTLFKYHLDLGHGREAYDAMMRNPDPVRKRECLRRLVVVLTEQRRLKELCDFTYTGLEEEIEQVIELRARSVDVTKHSYYDLLYCFHTSRGNHRKAAYVMYEHGMRLGREAPGPKSLHKQANCYCMTLTSLRLTDPKYAWVVRPVELQEVAVGGKVTTKRKRPQKSTRTKVEILSVSDIEKEYLLVRAKLSLIQREPSLTTQLASPFVSTEELVSLLVQVGLFDKAVTILEKFSLPLTPIFEALASRCVHLSVNVVSFRQSSGNTTTWDWLGLNESSTVTTVRENTIADKAWSMLRSYLETHDSSSGHVLQKCVARKLLSMGAQLPQWLVDKYKVTNPAELMKLYLTFDLLEAATRLAIEYIDSVMGHGKEICGIKTALHAKHPSVWLPYSTLDHLQLALREAPSKTVLQELSKKLQDKLERYLELVGKTTDTMKQEAARSSHRTLDSYSL